MDPKDQSDIIKKVKEEGTDNPDVVGDDGDNVGGSNLPTDEPEEENVDVDVDYDEEEVNEDDMSIFEEMEIQEVAKQLSPEELSPELYPDGWKEMDGIFMNPKKNNMFQPGSNDILTNGIYESLEITEKSSIFTQKIKSMIKESLNQEMEAPVEEPQTKPVVKPEVAPSRRNKPFLPSPEVNPDPKANK